MKTNQNILTIVLLIGLAVALGALATGAGAWRLPGNHQGYEPSQPLAFSHRMHAGELEIDCQYCHFEAETSRHAGIPPVNVCMNCHQYITTSWEAQQAENELAMEEERRPERVVSDKLRPLYEALGLDEDLDPDPEMAQKPIPWVKVHNLPDFVYFDHRAHVAGGVECRTCHGPVEEMDRVRQMESLSMGWCIECHRAPARRVADLRRHAETSTDCSTCHY